MRVKRVAIILSVLLLSVCSASAQDGTARLRVEVRDAEGRPLKHACVTLIPAEGEILFEKADGKGRIDFKMVKAGNYRLVAKLEGYVAQKKTASVAGAGMQIVLFDMQPAGER